jgi:hypothetical protein
VASKLGGADPIGRLFRQEDAIAVSIGAAYAADAASIKPRRWDCMCLPALIYSTCACGCDRRRHMFREVVIYPMTLPTTAGIVTSTSTDTYVDQTEKPYARLYRLAHESLHR